ncbi:MAG: DUF1015 domain-containing protein [Clostridia bacterium]
MKRVYEELGVHIPVVYLPDRDVDLTKWAVVACDQYTPQPEYWEQVERLVGNSPSTLRIIFPEAFLHEEDAEERIKHINATMKRYLDEDVILPQEPGLILVDRQTAYSKSRKGLILALDLEKYDYRQNAHSLIRATEGTVVDRLPPRIKVRGNASIELPHIMVLIDDPEKTVIEPLAEKAESFEKLYDFDLMLNGGHIRGYRIDRQEAIEEVIRALGRLADPELFRSKYGLKGEEAVLLFAVGDGNHSLATAKECWEAIKADLSWEEAQTHPARYALVELVNIHDEGLAFEPIHRVVFGINPEGFLEAMTAYFHDQAAGFRCRLFDVKETMEEEAGKRPVKPGCHRFTFVLKGKYGIGEVEGSGYNLVVGTLQAFLDHYIAAHPEIRVDYIHGEEVVDTLGSQEGNMGFFLPAMDKKELFRTVILEGVLPRKTFSMGEADEKRFYLECRKIRD